MWVEWRLQNSKKINLLEKEFTLSTSDKFKDFLSNIKVTQDKSTQVSNRYQEITKALNVKFRDIESSTANCLQVGSYGRWTAIKGISDLDMLYIMPQSKWDEYNVSGGQSKLLKDTKDAILKRYPKTTVFVDRLVVCVKYTDFHVEVQPVFKQEDGSYKYPDTYNGGCWKITKPQDELDEMKEMNSLKNRNLRRLCKMARAWKNKQGISIGGLLIDTLAYNFLKSTDSYDSKSYSSYDEMCRDFFKFLSEEPEDKDHYQALGSNQDVKVKESFYQESCDAYNNSKLAIDNKGSEKENNYWRKIFGSSFPKYETIEITLDSISYRHTEEFIEDKFPIDIRYKLKIACEVSKNGSYETVKKYFRKPKDKLKHGRSLDFHIENINIPSHLSYKTYWKVLNRGIEAKRRNCIRGQIYVRGEKISEHSSFNGEHLVECYIVENGVVIARDKIFVPIED